MCQSFSRVFILIDALDECGLHDALANLFVGQQSRRFNLLATSRSLPAIEQLFAGHDHIEIRADVDDVHAYLSQQMARLPNPARKDVHLHTDIKDTIVTFVDGM